MPRGVFSRYKAELLEGGAFADVEDAKLETFNYIEGYYNRIRRHSSLGYLSPEEYERQFVAARDEKLGQMLDNKTAKGIKRSNACVTLFRTTSVNRLECIMLRRWFPVKPNARLAWRFG